MEIYRIFSLLFQLWLVGIVADYGLGAATSFDSDFTEEMSHYGTEFYLGMTMNQAQGTRTLHIASEGTGNGRVQGDQPFIKLDEEIVLSKGYNIYNINLTLLFGVSIYISTSIPVAITVVDEADDSSNGAFLALPVSFASTSFMTSGAEGWYFGIAVMAVHDNTNVTLVDLENEIQTVTLNRLGFFSTRDYPDKTGTTVSANKAVTVNSGTTLHVGDQGMLIEQMLPYSAWADIHIVPPLFSKTTYTIRTLSMETQNVCFRNSTSQKCVQFTKADSNSTFVFGTEPVEISSSSRVSVMQYSSINNRFGSSDSIMITIPGIKNYLNTYKFAIPNTPNLNPYIVVIILSSEADTILLDGANVTFDTVHNITTSVGGYSVLMKTVTPGYHELRNANTQVKFGALAYRFDGKRSYAFPLGFAYTRSVNCSLNSWGPWSVWAACSVTCGGGLHTRTRTCVSEGQPEDDCTGEDTETQTCNSQACQDCNCAMQSAVIGVVLGIIIVILFVYASYATLLIKRYKQNKGASEVNNSKINDRRGQMYVNESFAVGGRRALNNAAS